MSASEPLPCDWREPSPAQARRARIPGRRRQAVTGGYHRGRAGRLTGRSGRAGLQMSLRTVAASESAAGHDCQLSITARPGGRVCRSAISEFESGPLPHASNAIQNPFHWQAEFSS